MEQKCVRCKHDRRQHSKNGCTEMTDMRTGKECSCKVKYMDVSMFR
jgi:hypothetical protein